MTNPTRCLSIILIFLHLAFAQKNCRNQVVFIITAERRAPLKGPFLFLNPSGSLKDCIHLCSVTNGCTSANFYKDPRPDGPSVCGLLDTKPVTQYYQLDQAEGAIYYAWAVCLPSSGVTLCNRSWSFELVPYQTLRNQQLIIDSISPSSVEECLVSCLKNELCRGVLYHRGRGLCQLTRINRHSIRDEQEYFQYHSEIDFYENNCVEEPSSACHFLLRKNEGTPDLYDSRIPNIFSGEECKAKCLDNVADGLCRSYTYDFSNNLCFLSHISPSTLPTPIKALRLVQSPTLEMGEIDDCIAFSLRCRQDGMTVSADARRLFSGRLSTRSETADAPVCGNSVQDAYNFQSTIAYKGCGTTQDEKGKFTNILFVKYGDGKLITYRDRLLKLICTILQQEEVEVKYQMHVIGENGTKTLFVTGSTASPRFKLQVLDLALKPVDKVEVGDFGYLEIQLLNPPTYGNEKMSIQIPNVVAVDEIGQNKVELFDEAGCTLNPDLSSSLERVGPDRIRAKINFFAFRNSGRVHYKGLVKPCWRDCNQVCPDNQHGSRTDLRHRNKRSIIYPDSVHILQDEQYQIETGVLVQPANATTHFNERYPTLKEEEGIIFRPVPEDGNGEKDFSKPHPSDVSNADPTIIDIDRVSTNPLNECFTGSLVCAITMTFALIQVTIIVLCSVLLYHYCPCVRNWFSRRSRLKSVPSTVSTITSSSSFADKGSTQDFADPNTAIHTHNTYLQSHRGEQYQQNTLSSASSKTRQKQQHAQTLPTYATDQSSHVISL